MTTTRSGMLARLPSAVVWLARLVLGCVLLSSSVAKLRKPYDFLANVYQYELVSPKVGLLVAITYQDGHTLRFRSPEE